ncbi:MAG: hypothetical protein IJV06_10510 [Bacteroidaceae bacterium]|nr:hypothetical protein [Bacteroidaceae bacterium]
MFHLKLTVSHLHQTNALDILADFIATHRTKYSIQEGEHSAAAASEAEAIIAVPFSARESIRIDFNIYAAQFESEHPEEPDVYFRMESL